MKTRNPWMLLWLAPLALWSCASHSARPVAAIGKVTAQMRSGSSELRAFQVEGWIAPDDRTLIVNSTDRSLFQGRFHSKCVGLRLVDTIGFIVPAPPHVESYEGIVLPNGTHCVFASFTKLVPASEPVPAKP